MAEMTSKIVKAGGRTYFFDLKEARTGDQYLAITESWFVKEQNGPVRNRILVFPEVAAEFGKVYAKMVKALK